MTRPTLLMNGPSPPPALTLQPSQTVAVSDSDRYRIAEVGLST